MEIEQEQYRTRPWVDKYRPKTLSNLISHQYIVETLIRYMQSANFPNLLMYGSPGTGKTSTIIACAKQLYGAAYKYMVLELNASDDRGINIVRNRIKVFSETQSPFMTCSIKFKLVILDEADSMTKDAQAALRRMMEKFSRTTRFCLIGNYVNKLIPAIQSRCTRFKFKKIPFEDAWQRVQEISKLEGMNISKDVIEQIINICKGDMRKIINLLQCLYLSGKNGIKKELTIEDLYQNLGIISPQQLEQIFKILCQKNFLQARDEVHTIMRQNGAEISAILEPLADIVLRHKYKQKEKIKLLQGLRQIEYRNSFLKEQDLLLDNLIALFVGIRYIK